MKAVKIPADLIISFRSRHESPAVGWTDGTRRYHIWLKHDGTPRSDVLHSNPIERNKNSRRDEHRALSITAKRWAPLVAAILEKVKSEGMIEKTLAEAEANQQALKAKLTQEANEERLSKLDAALKKLPAHIETDISNLSATTRLAFVEALVNGHR